MMKNKLIQLAIFTLFSKTLNAQITWEKLIIPDSVIRPTGIVEIDEGVLILSSTQGIIKSSDNGDSWYAVSDIAAYDIVYNPRNETMYTVSQVSFDLGETWIQTGPIFFAKITILSNNDLVMSGYNLIIRRSPDGTQYDTLYNPMETELRFCKVVEDADGYLYTGTYAYLGGGGMYRSDDYGESWNIISWDSVFVFDLAVGPDNELYAARYGGYSEPWGGGYKSEDSGETWAQIQQGDLAARAIVVLPDSTVFIGASSYGGVYRIEPNGNMGFVNDGLSTDVVDLYLSLSGILYAKIDPSGLNPIYEFYRTTEPVYVGINQNPQKHESLNVYPNPVTSTANIIYSTNELSKVDIAIFDVTGKNVYKYKVDQGSGDYKVPVSVKDIDNGVYFVKVSVNSKTEIKKIIISQ